MATFIKPCEGYLNSLVGYRVDPKTGKPRVMHRGADYTSHTNNNIVASAAGKVRFLDNNPNRTGFGRYLIITHDNGYETLYAHLASINVRLNQRVKQGQKIGVKGTTGKSTGVHLHFEMSKGRWNNRYTTNVNPILWIDDPEIRTVQEVLVQLGFYTGDVDGIHGDGSITAVEKFQKAKGFSAVDGIPGRGTMSVIHKEKDRIIKEEIERVKVIQSKLVKAGYKLKVDGLKGKATTNAIKTVQRATGLKVDGIAGKATDAKLNAIIANLNKPEPPIVKPVPPVQKPKEEEKVESAENKNEIPEWAEKAWEHVEEKRLIRDGRPNDYITRAELAVILARRDGLNV
ncbi:peptidoglycan-binding protein [Planococcus versutus]|uniref:Peptidase M23 n=1 Tax=Planococcus versutus TaxID=1302659 RepID=A0A1B1S5J9_9BACL|nr:peptidoglycan-binding protein [Planococcus versutus]ANU28468.1 hypothetical protein I858_015875 [Planococcus versutus]